MEGADSSCSSPFISAVKYQQMVILIYLIHTHNIDIDNIYEEDKRLLSIAVESGWVY